MFASRGRSMRGLWRTLIASLALLGPASCSDDYAAIVLPPLPDAPDGGAGGPGLPDGSVACTSDDDCDDGLDCSRDRCLPGGYCVFAADSSRCSDGVFCNGDEVCDFEVGCRDGLPRQCGDEDVCTIDYCDEASKRCVHEPRDFDDDGEVDWHCRGGTDCDDFDVTRAKAASEICADGIDNDCDDDVDEASCGRPRYDRCDDALDVSAGGRFVADLAGATADYALRCETPGVRDLALTFELATPRDVTLIATGLLSDGSEETAAIALRERCSDARSEIECSRGFPGQVRVRALPAGRYFVVVNSELASRVVVEARFDDPTELPSNATCASPLDVSAGGRFAGSFVDVGDEEVVPCGFAGANDLLYQFTTTELHDVEISALSETGERMNVEIRTACEDTHSALRCISDAPARARMHELPAGTYYVVLESSPSREVDFSFDIAFLEPTPAPPGDGCGNPLPLAFSSLESGTLAHRQDLIGVECGCGPDEPPSVCRSFLSDVVYELQLVAPGDLGIEINGGASPMMFDVRAECETAASQLACGNATLSQSRVRNLDAGNYYLIVESPDPASFTVQVEALPRTVPVVVTGNETCGTAFVVPPEGGLFAGDTLTMLNSYEAAMCGGGARSNDAVYALTLAAEARVAASLEATFDTVLYRFTDLGSGAESCVSDMESNCNDDGGQGNTNSFLSELLPAGSYYYVVDGFNDNNEGAYLLELTVTPP